jgi:alpha-L-rhamnosidase
MTRYVAYLGSKSKDHVVTHGLGDWYDIGPGGPGESKLTTKGLTATAIYYHDITIVQQVAELLGKSEAAARYAALARDVRTAFNRKFFLPETNQYDRASQTANAMPLVFGLVEPDRRAAVLENLVKDVRAHDNHVTAGDVGFRYLLLALAQGGRSDVIFDMNTRTNPPSYGSQLAQGATTLTEAWDANPSSSQNHCMLGHAEEWFYTDVTGIQPDPEQPGFRRIFIRPQPVGDLTWAKGSYDSIRGPIASEWEKKGNRFDLRLGEAEGVRFLRLESDRAVLAVESGRYHFAAEISP